MNKYKKLFSVFIIIHASLKYYGKTTEYLAKI